MAIIARCVAEIDRLKSVFSLPMPDQIAALLPRVGL